MKTNLIYLFTGIVLATSCMNESTEKPAETGLETIKQPLDSAGLLKRGGYLVTIGGCGDCHSPKVMTQFGPAPEPRRMLSGYNPSRPFTGYDEKITSSGALLMFNAENTAFAGPWGVSFAANLTPDDSGIGSWSLDQFKRALREGKYKGLENTRMLLPPMPWQNYTDMTDEDVKAIFVYLQSIEAVNNVVPAPVPPHRS